MLSYQKSSQMGGCAGRGRMVVRVVRAVAAVLRDNDVLAHARRPQRLLYFQDRHLLGIGSRSTCRFSVCAETSAIALPQERFIIGGRTLLSIR